MEKETLRTLIEQKGVRLADLAKRLDVEKSTVTRWNSKQVPAERVLEIERITGVSRHELRPDIYPQENGAAT